MIYGIYLTKIIKWNYFLQIFISMNWWLSVEHCMLWPFWSNQCFLGFFVPTVMAQFYCLISNPSLHPIICQHLCRYIYILPPYKELTQENIVTWLPWSSDIDILLFSCSNKPVVTTISYKLHIQDSQSNTWLFLSVCYDLLAGRRFYELDQNFIVDLVSPVYLFFSKL